MTILIDKPNTATLTHITSNMNALKPYTMPDLHMMSSTHYFKRTMLCPQCKKTKLGFKPREKYCAPIVRFEQLTANTSTPPFKTFQR